MLSLLLHLGFAQTTYKANNNCEVTIKGTSTLHDWHADVKETKANAVMTMEDGTLTAITSLKVTFVVKSIDTGENMMDKNTYKALKADEYPNITYKLKEIKSITGNGTGYTLSTSGTLTIAGVSKTVYLTVKAKAGPNGSIVFTGSHQLDMTDYQVDPPTAVFGTIKTGKDVTIDFKLSMDQIDS